MLARRELSEQQVRRRLARRAYPASVVEEAIGRLKEERSIDDARLAEVMANTQTSVKHHGRLRARSEMERAGIASSEADRALDEAFSHIDDDALLDAALARRLKGRDVIGSDGEFGRLYRYLIMQGFEHDRVMKALKGRRET
jgi:regulatory protein